MSCDLIQQRPLLTDGPRLSLSASSSVTWPPAPAPAMAASVPVVGSTRCSAGSVLAYVSTRPGDRIKTPGLTLAAQAQACQRYARCQLRKGLKTTFADRGRSLKSGFRQLVAHLTVCGDHLVVVHRLDRLPPSGFRALTRLGTRIVSATGERLPRRQAEFLADVARLARQRR